jgi:FkbH-like protein
MRNVKYAEIVKVISDKSSVQEGAVPYNVSIISNITTNNLANLIKYYLQKRGLDPSIKLGDYDNVVQESYNQNNADIIIVHIDMIKIIENAGVFIEDLSAGSIKELIETTFSDISLIVNNLKHAPAVLFSSFTASGIYNDPLAVSNAKHICQRLNDYLSGIETTNMYLMDIGEIISTVGRAQSIDYRMYYLSKNLYTIQFWKEYVLKISPLIFKLSGIQKKVLIFDCDNTLWGGILGEDGLDNIQLDAHSPIGQIFNQVQKIALWLGNAGVIIGICSKNNMLDVEEALAEHKDMILRQKSLSIMKVNWNDKASNIREIAEELNVSLDSIVFVDDSDFEINLVKEQLPTVETFQVPKNIHEYPAQLLDIIGTNFFLGNNTSDGGKAEQYQSQARRNEARNKYVSIDDYIASLDIKLDFNYNDILQVERISELTQKTNQFNMTTKRYTVNQILTFMKDQNYDVISISVSDKYGNSGLTAVYITKRHEKSVSIDTFIMSCRIMGRNIEKVILDYLVEEYKTAGFKNISAVFIPTKKNAPAASFYPEAGFSSVKKSGLEKEYSLKISDFNASKIGYIQRK